MRLMTTLLAILLLAAAPLLAQDTEVLSERIVSKCTRYKIEVDVTLRWENIADGSPCTYRLFGYQSSDGTPFRTTHEITKQ
ncbi:MAG: hypothetical protein IJK41_00750 [Muribaculaceae bacterium]|nr:hypothetical protein [Muribaculaceae bacterium]